MAAEAKLLTRESLEAAPYRYFDAIDAKDLEATMAQYAQGAVETVIPDNVTYRGSDEIRRMYVDFFASADAIRHEIQNVVVDAEHRKVATEQKYVGESKDGRKHDMYNCNFFEFDNAGKLERVVIWMSGASPLT
jgi:ketosteroid isomerase-like protein